MLQIPVVARNTQRQIRTDEWQYGNIVLCRDTIFNQHRYFEVIQVSIRMVNFGFRFQFICINRARCQVLTTTLRVVQTTLKEDWG